MGKLGLIFLLIFSFLFPSSPKVKKINENDTTLSLFGASAIVIEASSGRVLYQKNADEKHYPASMTKMMGMYILLRAIDQGELTFEEEVTCSPYAASMGGTQIYLEPGEKMSVKDLFKAVAINSANDAITALGEHINGSTEAFVKKMNDVAKDLGMKNTHFKNPTGFDDEEHVTTARDMSIIASHLVKFKETLFQFTRLKEAYIREDTANPFWLVNTNKMLGHYDGMDGLKTGYTHLAGYNLTATANRNGIRVISVVMKEDTIAHRAQDTTTLLNYAFSQLSLIRLYPMHHLLCKYSFPKAKEKDTPIYTKEEVNVVVLSSIKKEDLKARIILKKYHVPLKKGDEVGCLVIQDPSMQETYFPLILLEDVEVMRYKDYFLDALGRFLA